MKSSASKWGFDWWWSFARLAGQPAPTLERGHLWAPGWPAMSPNRRLLTLRQSKLRQAKCRNAHVLQALRAAQFRQVDNRRRFKNPRAHSPHQVGRRDQGAAGGDQVIEHQHRVAF